MCGRYFLNQPREEIAAAFRAVPGDAQEHPSYNIAPGRPVLAVRVHPKTGVRHLDDLQWGLVPHFAKERKIAFRTINARAETIESAASYRAAFAKRRCLIIADGFYEWQALGKHKQPYAAALRDGRPFAMAGVWENWKDPATGEWLRSCAIITTEANALLGRVHDRMPVILSPEDHAAWLGEEPTSPAALKQLLKPYSAAAMCIWPVHPRVNKPENDDPELLTPFTPPAPENDR
jgi:putative SOS response-associated peptidase YedK